MICISRGYHKLEKCLDHIFSWYFQQIILNSINTWPLKLVYDCTQLIRVASSNISSTYNKLCKSIKLIFPTFTNLKAYNTLHTIKETSIYTNDKWATFVLGNVNWRCQDTYDSLFWNIMLTTFLFATGIGCMTIWAWPSRSPTISNIIWISLR
jgi:hypothetical protein